MAKEKDSENKEFRVRCPKALHELISAKAKELHISNNEAVISALQEWTAKDISDSSLYIAKLSHMQKTLRLVDEKMEAFAKLFMYYMRYYYMRYFFLFSPDYPEDREAFAAALRNAEKRTQGFLQRYQKFIQETPRFWETIVGDTEEREQ